MVAAGKLLISTAIFRVLLVPRNQLRPKIASATSVGRKYL
jgi:hypothetical protein